MTMKRPYGAEKCILFQMLKKNKSNSTIGKPVPKRPALSLSDQRSKKNISKCKAVYVFSLVKL